MLRLQGQRVLITGASRGVGLAATRRFAREGADVALLARGREGLEKAAEIARAEGVEAHVVVADVADTAQVDAAVAEAVERLGGLDVLVLNAAAVVFGPFTEVSAEDFERTVRVSYLGVVDVVRAALPALEDSAGSIVATGSLMARIPLPMFSSYASAKHALRGFLGSLRVELRSQGSGVSISMVHPGAIATPLWGQTTSATGQLPRRPPEGYSPDAVARALVSCAIRPRAEVVLGGEAKALDLLFGVARPAADLVLGAMFHYFGSGNTAATEPGTLLRSPDDGQEKPRVPIPRPSLLGPLRLFTPSWAARSRPAQASSKSVTGPSPTRKTAMSAPKTPRRAPARSQKRSYNGSARSGRAAAT
jgi:NAD(P)-dependent dehydrogenase (short-subunit alcohol dehydrogenase family)